MNKKKKNWVSVLFVLFTGMVMAAGFASCNKKDGGVTKQEETSGTVTLYDGNLEEIESSWTYDPDPSGDIDMVELNFVYRLPMVESYTFIFTDGPTFIGPPGLTPFRDAVDKAIEWAAVTKENKVQKITKWIHNVEVPYMLDGRLMYTPMLLWLYFGVADFKGKSETLLLIRYSMQNTDDGPFLAFKEKDFKHLKKILSDESLAEARNSAQEKAKTADLFK